jgi:precorrin-2 dehydrogenase/sirohydrochlorin ferrochelatase
MRYYAVGLDLHQRPCVVVGGGAVATRRVDGLLACGARVTVVAPTLAPALEQRAAAGDIVVRRRPYEAGDLAGAFLAIVATDAPEVNAAVTAEARARGVLLNRADAPTEGDFIVMTTVQRGDLQLAICTAGRSPAFARRVREELERLLPPEYDQLLALQAELRTELQRAGQHIAPERWSSAADAEVLALLRAGDRAGAAARLRAHLLSPEARSLCS